MKPDATILAFDFGTQRIGVASGNTLTRTAQPLTTIAVPRSSRAIDAVAPLIDEWRPARLVVGLPVHADGTAHAMTARAR
ncbi:MAG TPA: Holliday junction resolvase RuvX, partial [Casimicrobiaceae bacterium]|nr:Holliday junction resolvase RuvX [Casimicrobiaceae bacterium]